MTNEMVYMNHIYPSQCRYCANLDTEYCKLEIENCECKNYVESDHIST